MSKVDDRPFSALLKSKGFRVTQAREAVLSILESSDRPLSPSAILRKIGSQANQATIYRILEHFASAGIVHRVNMEHTHAHYELARSGDHHHHIICRVCGATEHITSCTIPESAPPPLQQSKHFQMIDGHALEYFGICVQCARSAQKHRSSPSR